MVICIVPRSIRAFKQPHLRQDIRDDDVVRGDQLVQRLGTVADDLTRLMNAVIHVNVVGQQGIHRRGIIIQGDAFCHDRPDDFDVFDVQFLDVQMFGFDDRRFLQRLVDNDLVVLGQLRIEGNDWFLQNTGRHQSLQMFLMHGLRNVEEDDGPVLEDGDVLVQLFTQRNRHRLRLLDTTT